MVHFSFHITGRMLTPPSFLNTRHGIKMPLSSKKNPLTTGVKFIDQKPLKYFSHVSSLRVSSHNIANCCTIKQRPLTLNWQSLTKFQTESFSYAQKLKKRIVSTTDHFENIFMNNSLAEVTFRLNTVKVLGLWRFFHKRRWGSVYKPTARSKGLPTHLYWCLTCQPFSENSS